jgi:hypothetical protein
MKTKSKHQNKTAAPLRLTKAPVCPDTKPQNQQARKATHAQQQQKHAKQKNLTKLTRTGKRKPQSRVISNIIIFIAI